MVVMKILVHDCDEKSSTGSYYYRSLLKCIAILIENIICFKQIFQKDLHFKTFQDTITMLSVKNFHEIPSGYQEYIYRKFHMMDRYHRKCNTKNSWSTHSSLSPIFMAQSGF